MTLPATINGFTAWGGNPPMLQPSNDGSLFWGRNEKDPSGKIYYTVYHEIASLYYVVLRSAANAGQGALQIGGDGKLYASLFLTVGDGSISGYSLIAGYVPSTQDNSGLSTRYKNALDRLCAWLGIP